MLTIKHVEDSRCERVVSVESVSFDPGAGVLVGYGAVGHVGSEVKFSSGHAFVMNDAGKTVAAYNLRPIRKEQKA